MLASYPIFGHCSLMNVLWVLGGSTFRRNVVFRHLKRASICLITSEPISPLLLQERIHVRGRRFILRLGCPVAKPRNEPVACVHLRTNAPEKALLVCHWLQRSIFPLVLPLVGLASGSRFCMLFTTFFPACSCPCLQHVPLFGVHLLRRPNTVQHDDRRSGWGPDSGLRGKRTLQLR